MFTCNFMAKVCIKNLMRAVVYEEIHTTGSIKMLKKG